MGFKGSVLLRALRRTGFFHIFGAATVSKMLMALQSVVLVRLLSQSDFGTYSYAFNIVSLLLLFNGAGAVEATLQLCSEYVADRPRMSAFYTYATRSGVRFDLALGIAIVGVGMWGSFSIPGAAPMVMAFAAYPLFTLVYDLRLTWLRVNRQNQVYSANTAFRTILYVVFSLTGAYIGAVSGLIVGQYLALLSAMVVMHFWRRDTRPDRTLGLGATEKGEYWSVALVSALNSGLSSALALLGTFTVGAMMSSPDAVAVYKVATVIPFALMFIPGVIGTYTYPQFASKRWDREWTLRRYTQLVLTSLVLFGSVSAILFVGARPLLVLLFSEQYTEAATPLRVLLIGFVVNAAFRAPTGAFLVTQRRLAFNTFVAVVSIVVVAILNVALVPTWGPTGAAIAYSVTMFVGATLSVPYYLYRVRQLPT